KHSGPRIIRKHKESDYTNPGSNWFKITTFLGGLSAVPAWKLLNEVQPPRTQAALAVCSVCGAALWWKYCGLYPRRADKTWRHFWFRIDKKMGNHKFNKWTTGKKVLAWLYPVKKIHDHGIVEFENGHYCVYVDLNPKKLTDQERQLHRMFMKGLVDGLHNDQMFKMVATSKRNPRKQIINFLLKIANKAGSKDRAQHMNSIIQKILKDDSKTTTFKHYAMIGLGKHDNITQAEIAKGSLVDGIMENMKRAHLRPALIENKRQLQKIFRESVSERVMF
ncbi:MAG: hypothetical protein ABFC30_01595, partial [Proteiniphilum sp.]